MYSLVESTGEASETWIMLLYHNNMTYCAVLFDEYIDWYYIFSINVCSNKCRVYQLYLPIHQSSLGVTWPTTINLTGLESNRVYTNISVQAVNSAGRSERSAVTARYNHTSPTGKSEDTHDCIHVSTDVLSISCTHTLYLQQYRSALEVHVLLSNGVGLFYLWLVPPSVTVHHFGTHWAHRIHSQQQGQHLCVVHPLLFT